MGNLDQYLEKLRQEKSRINEKVNKLISLLDNETLVVVLD